MLKVYTQLGAAALRNVWRSTYGQITYVVEPHRWAVRAVGEAVTRELTAQRIPARLTTTALGVRHQLVHFGSIDTFMAIGGWRRPHPSNRTVVTVYHVSPLDRQLHLWQQAMRHVDIVHTTNSLTQQQLVELEVAADKIRVIPLGVDSQLFQSQTAAARRALRQQHAIPDEAFVVGSFQKDGVGWGAGREPKLIKGPDVFIDVIRCLTRTLPVWVALVGPARGYVRDQLRQLNVPYLDAGYLHDTRAVAPYYSVLDAYLITSRVEGGPLQLLEAWAAGVPVVSTSVGMVRDVARHEHDALVTAVDDVSGLQRALTRLAGDAELGQRLASTARERVPEYDWRRLATRYYNELYKGLLESIETPPAGPVTAGSGLGRCV